MLFTLLDTVSLLVRGVWRDAVETSRRSGTSSRGLAPAIEYGDAFCRNRRIRSGHAQHRIEDHIPEVYWLNVRYTCENISHAV